MPPLLCSFRFSLHEEHMQPASNPPRHPARIRRRVGTRVVPRGVNMALAYGESVRLLDLPDLLLCVRDDPRQPNPQDPHDSFKRLDAGVLLSSFEESVEYTVGIAVLGGLPKRDERRVRGFLAEERATREGRSGEA